ncbi:MAG: hypothetical protein ACOY3K_06180 [Candidatus Omnitrophota bacterium]
MKKNNPVCSGFFWGSLILMSFCGCATLHMRDAEIYPMSYDKTFMLAVGALDDMGSWRVAETDHQNGKIVIENSGYVRPTQRHTILVQKLEPFRTKVELSRSIPTPFNQHFFRAIDRRVEETLVNQTAA